MPGAIPAVPFRFAMLLPFRLATPPAGCKPEGFFGVFFIVLDPGAHGPPSLVLRVRHCHII